MKQFLMAVLCIGLLGAAPALACDICGCGVSNYNPYLFPHLSKNYIGLSYVHRVFHTRPLDEPGSTERYATILLSGQYRLGKRIQLTALLPWQENTLLNEAGSRRLSGLGDVTLLGQFRVWDHLTKSLRQTVLVGGGVKLATGKFMPAATNKTDEQNFQLGTGSTDYLLNGSYRLSFRRWVFGASGSYKYNTSNADGFRYGDVINVGMIAVYRKDWEHLSLSPYVQLNHESQYRDADQHILQKYSGGTVFYAGGGIDLNTQKVTFGLNYQFAADQSLGAGQITAAPKFSAHASFSF
jgi:hypothetical protein